MGSVLCRVLCYLGFHDNHEVGQGQSIHYYYECTQCKKRGVIIANAGYQPLRKNWLNGGTWESPLGEDNPPPLPVAFSGKT